MLPTILIPVLKPDDKMIILVRELLKVGFSRILVVDDGSGPEYEEVFAKAASLGCSVLTHAVNKGKGRAIKTGFRDLLLKAEQTGGVITVDADGQHLPADIYNIALAMRQNPDALVLGVRQFAGHVPIRNRTGNKITKSIFALIDGTGVADTQTGLRGYSSSILASMLELEGEKYDFEMSVLLAARPLNIPVVQVPIKAVYIGGNKFSHYVVFDDSLKIYKLIFRFMLPFISAGLLDYVLFALLTVFNAGYLFLNVVSARLVRVLFNYFFNKNLIFKYKDASKRTKMRYYLMVASVLLANSAFIYVLYSQLGLNIYLAKIIADVLLGLAGFYVKRDFVIGPQGRYKTFSLSEPSGGGTKINEL